MKNKLLKKIFISTLVFILFLNVFNNIFIQKVFATGDATEQSLQGLQGLSDQKYGLMTCDPYSENKISDGSSSLDHQCAPVDFFKLFGNIIKVLIFVIVISLVLMIIISGVGYVYTGNSPAYLAKWKKHIKNSVYALLILVFAVGLIFGILAAVGMKSDVLQFIQKMFANNNFIFQKAYADDISSLANSSLTDKGVNYINFFPNQSIPSLILLAIKFLINYIAAPALVGATIWCGFLFVKAEGNSADLGKAKKFALRVLIGILCAAAASTVVNVLLNTLNDVSDETSYIQNTKIRNFNSNIKDVYKI